MQTATMINTSKASLGDTGRSPRSFGMLNNSIGQEKYNLLMKKMENKN